MTSFIDLGVPARLAEALKADGKTEPFPIQIQTLPDALAGRDVLGRGRTGSGKTIAFSVPLVARLAQSNTRARAGEPLALVLAPTRELATQIAATITPLAAAEKLRVTTIFGGVNQRPQEQALARGVDIVVACPGRLEDLMKQGVVRLNKVRITVLDEADHMADLGFLPGVTRILNATDPEAQRLLFSATLDRGVDKLVDRFLTNEVRHSVDEASVPQGEMTHRVFVTADNDSKKKLVQTLASGRGRRILFTRTKHQAKKLAKVLTAAGIPAVDLHGNLSQAARDRNLAAFGADPENGGVRVLVATDVAARGVHVDDVELVVHVDPPAEHKAYLHRSGRTARAGASGVVVTVVLEGQEKDVKSLLKQAKIAAELERVSADAPAVTELVGEVAAKVKPQPKPPVNQGGGGKSQGANAQRKRAAAAARRGGAKPSAGDAVAKSGQPSRAKALSERNAHGEASGAARQSARSGANRNRSGANSRGTGGATRGAARPARNATNRTGSRNNGGRG